MTERTLVLVKPDAVGRKLIGEVISRIEQDIRDLRIGLRFHVRAAYFYQHGVHQLRSRNINAPLAGLGRPDPAVGN